jgi:hypothetical protein
MTGELANNWILLGRKPGFEIQGMDAGLIPEVLKVKLYR